LDEVAKMKPQLHETVTPQHEHESNRTLCDVLCINSALAVFEAELHETVHPQQLQVDPLTPVIIR
jgi:hypothetical protein